MRQAQRAGWLGLCAMLLTGCAGPRAAQIQDLKSQLVRLDTRLATLEQRHGLIEGKAWNQREDVSYLKGRLEGIQVARGSSPALVSQPTQTQIQTALKNAGFYSGSVDGKIGPKTKQAIREFQRVHGLKPDAVVGPKTWAQLAPHLSSE